MSIATYFLERGMIPDSLIRYRICQFLKQRLRDEAALYLDPQHEQRLLESFKQSAIAVDTQAANEQHYEVPAAFFKTVLGRHLKYSCCFWESGDHLDHAEERALQTTVYRADLKDGQQILELGCGWGSLTLFMASQFPSSEITAVSNSASQRLYIEQQCRERGYNHVRVITCDMNAFEADRTFDRIVSVEMMEHMRNWEVLFGRISSWLKPEGKFFMHIFTHTIYTYLYEYKDTSDWMSKYFFTGGMMPSEQLPYQFNKHLEVESQWTWNGTHYAKTAEAWLQNQDANRRVLMPVLEETYGKKEALKWWNYWRVFWMACAELWAYRDGKEWTVNHYVLKPKTH